MAGTLDRVAAAAVATAVDFKKSRRSVEGFELTENLL
jgi:hypothetical protein